MTTLKHVSLHPDVLLWQKHYHLIGLAVFSEFLYLLTPSAHKLLITVWYSLVCAISRMAVLTVLVAQK
jgi:hypothetical protein